jgi:chromosome segregation ATPase
VLTDRILACHASTLVVLCLTMLLFPHFWHLRQVAKLARAEQAVEKYQKRLEELVEVKKTNKELCAKLDEYVDQIQALESSNKGLATLQKLVETYKNKAVELETEKIEAVSSVQMRDQQVAQLRADLDRAREARRQAMDECASLRVQMEAAAVAEEEGGSPRKGGAGLDEGYHTETLPELREKVRRLERELRLAQTQPGGAGGEGAEAAGAGGLGAAGEVALMQAELDDSRQQKKRLEEALLATKKQLAEAQVRTMIDILL